MAFSKRCCRCWSCFWVREMPRSASSLRKFDSGMRYCAMWPCMAKKRSISSLSVSCTRQDSTCEYMSAYCHSIVDVLPAPKRPALPYTVCKGRSAEEYTLPAPWTPVLCAMQGGAVAFLRCNKEVARNQRLCERLLHLFVVPLAAPAHFLQDGVVGQLIKQPHIWAPAPSICS